MPSSTSDSNQIKKGPREGPRRVALCEWLEGELRHKSDGACVAGKYSLRVIEDGIARSQVVQIAGAVRAGEERSNVIHPQSLPRIAAWNVLRVIQDIGELRADTKFESLGDVDVLIGRE